MLTKDVPNQTLRTKMNNYQVPCHVMITREFLLDIVANSPEEAIEIAKAMIASSDQDDRKRVDMAYDVGAYIISGDEPIEVTDDPYLVEEVKDEPKIVQHYPDRRCCDPED